MKRRILLAVGGVATLLLVFLASFVTANVAGLEFVGGVLFGWIGFLRRVLPKVQASRAGVVTGLVCLVVLALGLHAFLRWLYANWGPNADRIGRTWRRRWTASIVGVVVLMFVAGIAAGGVVHQFGWLLSERASWTEYRERDDLYAIYRLGTVGFVLVDYQRSIHPGLLPTRARYDSDGTALHGWQTLILPYLGYLSDHIDLDVAWNDPRNAMSFKSFIRDYLNPAVAVVRSPEGYALSHYAGNIRVLGRTPRPIASLPAGLSQTLLFGEAAARFQPWGDPSNGRDPTAGLNTTPDGFASPDGGPVLFLFADGSVRRVGADVDPAVLRSMSGVPEPGP